MRFAKANRIFFCSIYNNRAFSFDLNKVLNPYLRVIKKSFLNHIAQTSPTPPMYEFVRGDGIYLFDKSNNAYVDLISGIAVNNLGHNNKKTGDCNWAVRRFSLIFPSLRSESSL